MLIVTGSTNCFLPGLKTQILSFLEERGMQGQYPCVSGQLGRMRCSGAHLHEGPLNLLAGVTNRVKAGPWLPVQGLQVIQREYSHLDNEELSKWPGNFDALKQNYPGAGIQTIALVVATNHKNAMKRLCICVCMFLCTSSYHLLIFITR